MADNPTLCDPSAAYENLNCCYDDSGVTVVQPKCHCIPDGRVVTNPCYVSLENKSYWTYKVLTDCKDLTIPLTSVAFPVCEIISNEILTVSEKIDGCGEYTSVPYVLIKDDPDFGLAPDGFQWVRIEVNGRYTKGVSVAYRLELTGNFPNATQPIKTNFSGNVVTFDCNGGYIVPECNPQGKLSLTKEATTIIENNQARLEYTLKVDNIGNARLEEVTLLDTLFLPTQLTPGTITTNPDTLDVTINPGGQIVISGNLGSLDPGQEKIITYLIPIAGISQPGQYVINNLAVVESEGTEASDTASTPLDVVKLDADKCCSVLPDGSGEFKISIDNVGDSPDVVAEILDDMVIPTGVTIKFLDFSGCKAVFASTGDPVPINTDITGNTEIIITADDINIPKGSSANRYIKFKVVSSSVTGTANIRNELETVAPINPDEQVYMGAGVLPVEANIKVILSLDCDRPCS